MARKLMLGERNLMAGCYLIVVPELEGAEQLGS